ncbi:MAG: hypothetical protein ACLR8U_00025 [Oscillospiraceae bacterium]
MLILLRTQVDRTDKTPVTARRARVSSLCGFRSPAERVLAQHQKTGRCANVRDRCGNGKRRRRTSPGEFWQREKPQAAKQEKGLTLFCASPSTSARSAGSFGG